jgi:hypothetical protein
MTPNLQQALEQIEAKFCGTQCADPACDARIGWMLDTVRAALEAREEPEQVVSATSEHPAIYKTPEGKLRAGSKVAATYWLRDGKIVVEGPNSPLTIAANITPEQHLAAIREAAEKVREWQKTHGPILLVSRLLAAIEGNGSTLAQPTDPEARTRTLRDPQKESGNS